MCPDDWLTMWQRSFFWIIKEIKKVGKDLGITPTIIRDEELKERGFGGTSCWIFHFLPSWWLECFAISIVMFHLHIPLFSRYLWSWKGSSASPSPGSSQSHSRWCHTDHCLGGQRYCVWHWRTQHQGKGTETLVLLLHLLTLLFCDEISSDNVCRKQKYLFVELNAWSVVIHMDADYHGRRPNGIQGPLQNNSIAAWYFALYILPAERQKVGTKMFYFWFQR